MHDNARPHVARGNELGVVNEYLNEIGLRRLEWPPCSPDLNPIEHLCDELKRAVRRRPIPSQTLQELSTASFNGDSLVNSSFSSCKGFS